MKMYEDVNKPGIYEILNRVTGKIYVGSAVDISTRIYRHFVELRGRRHCNKILQRSYIKHSTSVFDFRVLEYCDKDELIKREQYWMDLLEPEYNICKKAGSSLGRKHTPESLEKMSRVQREMYELKGVWSKGVKFTEEHKKNMSLCRIGKPVWNKGIPRTDEEKRKMSVTRRANISKTEIPVIQKTMEGEFIRAWRNISLAQVTLGYPKTHGISLCCQGIYSHSKGFKWEYDKGLDKDDPNPIYKL